MSPIFFFIIGSLFICSCEFLSFASSSPSSSSPYSSPSVIGYGLTFSITSPSFLAGDIAYLPVMGSRSPLQTIVDAEIVLPNSRDSNTGCDTETGTVPVLFTPIRDDGRSFNNTVLLINGSASCNQDFSGLPIVAVIMALPGYTSYFIVPTVTYPIPILVPMMYSDVSLLYAYLSSSSSSNNTSSSSSSSSFPSSSSSSSLLVTVKGGGSLVDDERRALRSIAGKFNYSNDLAMGNQAVNASSLMSYPESPSYDPCTDDKFMTRIWCENHHIVLIFFEYIGLIGPFPSEFAVFTSLRYFDIGYNYVSGSVSDSMCAWSELVYFSVESNAITYVPDCFDRFRMITNVLLGINLIAEFPISLLMTNNTLQVLDVSANLIPSFPSLSSMTSLVYLLMNSNNASGEIFSFDRMTAVNYIDLHDNRISGSMSSTALNNLPALTYFDISYNLITGSPPSLTNSTSLQYLNLAYNSFSGACPASWSLLSSLSSALLSHNNLTYVNSYPFSSTLSLTMLDLSYNRVSVPSSYVPLASGGFSAFIAQTMCTPMLTTLMLDGNKISGSWIAGYISVLYCPVLAFLSLSHNEITSVGTDVFELYVFPPISRLDLSYNALSGSLPPSLSSSSPPFSVTFLSFLHNPLFIGATLPRWLTLSTTSYHTQSNVPYVCPDYETQMQTTSMTVLLDATYTGYQGCLCENGYYGVVPFCQEIPSMVLSNASNPVFTDEDFGEKRYSSGMDTAWLLSPAASTRVIYVNITVFPSVFRASTDELTVYSGNSSLAPVVFTLLGGNLAGLENFCSASSLSSSSSSSSCSISTSSSSPSSSSSSSFSSSSPLSSTSSSSVSYLLTVLSSSAFVSFKSKSVTGTHFRAQYAASEQCPQAYLYDAELRTCTKVIPIFEVSRSLQIIVYVSSSLVSCLILFCLLFVLYHRSTIVIRSSALPFCILILVCLVVMAAGSSLYAMQPNDDGGDDNSSNGSDGSGGGGDVVCAARMWLTCASIVGVLALLLTKANRINTLFNTTNLNALLRMNNKDLFLNVLFLLLCEVILLLVATFLPLSVGSTLATGTGNTAGYRVHQCQTNDGYTTWLAVQFAFVALLLVIGITIAWRIRKVPTAFNESSHIVNCIYVLLSIGIIVVVVQFVVQDNPNALIIIRGLGQCFVSLSLTLALFGPKIYLIVDGRGNDESMTSIDLQLSKSRGFRKQSATAADSLKKADEAPSSPSRRDIDLSRRHNRGSRASRQYPSSVTELVKQYQANRSMLDSLESEHSRFLNLTNALASALQLQLGTAEDRDTIVIHSEVINVDRQ